MAEDAHADLLRSPRAGALVIRGGALRALGYAAGVALAAGTSVFLLRGLGVQDFGRYATVAALLGVVSTVSDAGLTAVGVRELALRPGAEARERLLGNLVALRLGLAVAGIGAAAVFALAAGYDRVMVAGVLLGGIGILLVNTQATMMAPLSVELRLGRITAVEVLRQVVTFAGVAALALAGASLLPYFGVQVLVGLVVLALTPKLLGTRRGLVPRLARGEAWALLRQAAPVAVALAMSVLYLRLLVILVSLTSDATETGLYATAFRVVELFVVVPPMVVGVAIPLLATAAADDLPRLRYALQALVEAAAVGSLALALVVTVVATPALRLVGGEAFVDAAPMLQIQVWALVPLAVASVLSFGLLSLHRERALAVANAAALVAVLSGGLALVALYGGEGAAVAGVVAEVVLLAALVLLLRRAEPGLVPRARFAWRPAAALAAGLATLLLPLPDWIDGLVAGLAFAVVALLVSALPREVLEALRRRAPGDRA